MHLYTLTPDFMPKDYIGEFISAIWTERYSAAGDVQLVTPASSDMVRKLAHGTFLGLRGTKEVMLLDTQSIENGLLTVSGQSLLKFLDERPAWFANPDPSADQATLALTEVITAGELIADAVYRMVINPVEFTEGPAAQLNLNWARETIPGLELGVVDSNGEPKRLTINLGTLYNSIQSLAKDEGVGLKLYLESATSTTGPVLKFATYRGKDRTSGQTTHNLVRLTPKMDSLSDVKEVSSRSNYKNVVYVVYKGLSIHYAEPSLPIPIGFNRRVLVVTPEDIYLEEARYDEYRFQIARDAFANNNYVQTVDGQASPAVIYKFGEDYDLGDIIELEGLTGTLSKARVSEYIRTQDKAGEREYPTLSVLDPLSTDFMPDTEPDPGDPPGTGDPEFEDPNPDPDPDPVPDPEPDPNPDPDPFPDPDDIPVPDPDPDPTPQPDPETPIITDDWEPTPDNPDTAELVVSNRVPASGWEGYYTAHLHAETIIQYTPPPGWGEKLADRPNSYGENSDSFRLYGLLVELSIGQDAMYPYLTQAQMDRWVMPWGPEGDDPGGYVVRYEEEIGNSWTSTLPAISIDFTYTASPHVDLWYRIPPPQDLGPISLRLVKTGLIQWYIAPRYQFGFKLTDGQTIDDTWSVPWVHGNFALKWEYHLY